MKRVVVMLALCAAILGMAVPVAAQTPEQPPTDRVLMWIYISSGFAMAIASAACGIAQAKATSAACEGLARNPGAAPAIRFALILALVLIESLALYTFAIVYLKVKYPL